MSDYFDIQSILAEQEKIVCQLNDENIHLSTLLAQKSLKRLQLPLWLVFELAKEHIVEIEGLPKCFHPENLEKLRSDATSVHLNEFSHHFYRVGHLMRKDTLLNEGVVDVLSNTFKERLQMILNHANSLRSQKLSDPNRIYNLLNVLDEFEKRVFHEAFNSFRKSDLWWQRRQNMKKRSREE